MRFYHLVALAFTFVNTMHAAELPSAQEIIAENDRAFAKAMEGVKEKVSRVDKAVSDAVKAGTLKASTEAFYRECLSRFTPGPNGMLVWDKLYYPPKFDTSEEMEMINLAWHDLQQEATRLQEEIPRISAGLLNAAAAAVQSAARSAEKPEDLENAELLIAAYRKVPDLTSRARYSGYGNLPAHEVLTRLVASMREALDARQTQDIKRLVYALQRPSIGPTSTVDGTRIPFRGDVVWDEFRDRITPSLSESVRQLQKEVEEHLIARKPVAGIEKTLETLKDRSSMIDIAIRSARTDKPLNYESRQLAVFLYRKVAELLQAIEQGRDTSTFAGISNALPDNISPEFRSFVFSIAKEIDEQQRASHVQTEAKRRAEMQEAERLRKEEDANRIAREQEQARKLVTGAIAKVRARILAVRSPQEARTLADELPDLLPIGEPLRHPEESFNISLIRQIQQELRQAASWWSGAEEFPVLSQVRERPAPHAFASEMRQLKEIVLRDTIASRYAAPELKTPPLSEISVPAAVERLAAAAAEQGNWKRSVDLLQTVASTGVADATNERIKAIRAYLIGLNFEQAEQFREAVDSYQSVLQQIAEHTPVKESAERLKKLRSTHPEAFATKPSTQLSIP